MPNADLYNALSAKTGKTFAELERELALGNGAIGKALKRNSTIKPVTIEKIAKKFPDAAEALGLKTEAPHVRTQGAVDWERKYYAMLEENQQLIKRTAEAAIVAANNLAPRVDVLEETAVIDRVTVLGTQEYFLHLLAPIVKSKPDLMRAELGKKILAEKIRNGIPVPSGKQSKINVGALK